MTETCAGTHIRLAARRITRFLETHMRAAGLSLAQFGLMNCIAAAKGDTIGALAERMDLDQSTLSRNLHSLERAGLVEIVPVERDLRRRAVWLTEKGTRRLEVAMPVWRRAHDALSDVIEPADVLNLTADAEALTESTDDKIAVNQ